MKQGPGTQNQGTREMKGASAPKVSGTAQTAARNQTLPNVQPTAAISSAQPPMLTWQKGSFSLKDILNNFPLPRVIQCDHSQCGAERQSHGFDCSQPLLLYSSLVSLKVSAGGLAVNIKDGKSLVETDSRLLVSEDYKGWFAVLGSDMTQKTIPHYRGVAQLSQSECHTFLVGGFDNVKTLKKVGESISEGRHLCPGDVLKMGVLVDGNKYLHCTDDRDRDVLLPLDGVGVFLVITYKTKPSRTPVLQIKDIIGKYAFPCNVKLVYGREPADAGVFTRFMVLEGVREHTSLLTATVLKPRSTLHELPVEIRKKFRVAVPSSDLHKSAGYARAMSLCVDSGDRFMRGIRLFKKGSEVQPNVTTQKTNITNVASQSDVTNNEYVEPLPSPNKELHALAKPMGVIVTRRAGADSIVPPTVKTGKAAGSNGTNTTVKPKPTENSSVAPSAAASRPNAYEKVWSASSAKSSSDNSRTSSSPTQQRMDRQLVPRGVHVDSNSQSPSARPPAVNGASVAPSTADRTHEYEMVWPASSAGKGSNNSSTTPVPKLQGIGGQVVTGGVHVDSNKQNTSPSIQAIINNFNVVSHKKDTNVITDTVPPKPCKAGAEAIGNPKPCKSGMKIGPSFQTNVNVVTNSQSNDRHVTPEVEKRKKVSFATSIDVHTDDKQSVVRLAVNDLTKNHVHFTDGDSSKPKHSTGNVVSFEDFSPAFFSEHGEIVQDKTGYIPLLDRKGRVKPIFRHSHNKETRTKESLAKMVSNSNISYDHARREELDTETQLLY